LGENDATSCYISTFFKKIPVIFWTSQIVIKPPLTMNVFVKGGVINGGLCLGYGEKERYTKEN
jgi:hypothetical protein